MPYGAITSWNCDGAPNGSARMSPRTRLTCPSQLAAAQTPAGPREHRRRPIDPDDMNAGARDGKRDAPGAAAEFEDGAARPRGQARPERHVAPADRARVLPVVERRVLVPARPSLHSECAVRSSECGVKPKCGVRNWECGLTCGVRRAECERRRAITRASGRRQQRASCSESPRIPVQRSRLLQRNDRATPGTRRPVASRCCRSVSRRLAKACAGVPATRPEVEVPYE